MFWKKNFGGLPVLSWCRTVEADALQQAVNLSLHPACRGHVALMPDCHTGFGMPIGGVIACGNAVIPNAVGVDIGCGMIAVETSLRREELDRAVLAGIMNRIKSVVPLGEGNAHARPQIWKPYDDFIGSLKDRPGWLDSAGGGLDRRNLGTLGGGNHFIEIQADEKDAVWIMVHSGSRNLGYRIAEFYNRTAVDENRRHNASLPSKDLAFLHADDKSGRAYIRDMEFALAYACENRHRMMTQVCGILAETFPGCRYEKEINIHHNFAAFEKHYGMRLWIHRKGATSAKTGEFGIIPGSMGTASYIVRGRGNPQSFMSCSHGAGRRMGRRHANENLRIDECNAAMQGILFDPWRKISGRRTKGRELYDLSEAPQAYKDIGEVISAELDLIEPVAVLRPLAVLKG